MNKRSGLADSPFFNSPTQENLSAHSAEDPIPRVPAVGNVRPVRPVPSELPVPPARPTKRVLKHHPFDIYIDQLERLKELKLQAMRRGEEVSMSRMVREALDAYFLKKQV